MGRITGIFIFLVFLFRLSVGQIVTTVAGDLTEAGDQDGQALTEATFNNPHGIAIDGKGIIYIADRWNHKIRRFDPHSGLVSTLAGTGTIGSADGPGHLAKFHSPWGITADSIGNVYVADTKNQKIRKIDTLGIVSTYAGSGSFGVSNGPRLSARFADPTGITIAEDGTLYVCDHLAHTIRKITPTGTVSTLAGKAFVTGAVDGQGSQASFHRPYGIELDFEGNIIVADEWNHLIRKISPLGVVNTIAGNGNLGSQDGPAEQAEFNYPWDVVIDQEGSVYVMDGYNYIMRKIQDGRVETWAGEAGVDGSKDGVGNQASFSGATTLCMNHNTCEIYVGDAFNNLIRKVEKVGTVSIKADFSESGDTLCTGHQEIFRGSPEIYNSYQLWINEVAVHHSTLAEFVYSFDQPGTYSIQIEATDSIGQIIQSAAYQLYIVSQPKAEFSYSIAEENSSGLRIQFETSVQAEQYFWNFGDPSSGSQNESGLQAPEHLYVQPGDYDVNLKVQNSRECSDSLLQKNLINFHQLSLTSQEISTGDTICEGEALTFEAVPASFESYEFYANGTLVRSGIEAVAALNFQSAGEIAMQVIGIDHQNNRVESGTFKFFVAERPETSFSFTLSGNNQQGLEVQFANGTPEAKHFGWDFGDPQSGNQNSSNEANPVHVYSQYGTYNVQLISSIHTRCPDTLLKSGLIHYQEQDSRIFIPTAFSPNGDGLNDHFYIRGQDIRELDVSIFNEWGELIYQITHPDGNWDGRRNGILVQPDTYVYLARVATFNKAPVILHGQITVLR